MKKREQERMGLVCPGPELVDSTPPSRPLTPSQQVSIMHSIEAEEQHFQGEPTAKDTEVCNSWKSYISMYKSDRMLHSWDIV